ncbi:hypothetical protein I4U23_012153 [Adineta vaga]|nr:hypothetical protein I4U23_012153 [Adineta vaga]
MGSGCCKKTKIADASLTVIQRQNEAAMETPFGYVFIYPGAPTSKTTYACPILSIHTYKQSSEKIAFDYTSMQLSNKKRYDRHLDAVTTAREEQLSSEETVIMIPVEDVINIYYTSDVKRSIKTREHSKRVPVVDQKGCCCCCKEAPGSGRETELIEDKHVQRMITIHLQYSKYSNLHTVSGARIVPESDRTQFYKNHFQPNTEMKFYLLHNMEYNSTNFEQKKEQAENLCRIIMQLKGLSGAGMQEKVDNASTSIFYPSPQDLQQILSQSHYDVFGDIHQERSHSIQTRQDFGTHVPAPVTTMVLASIEEQHVNKTKADNE